MVMRKFPKLFESSVISNPSQTWRLFYLVVIRLRVVSYPIHLKQGRQGKRCESRLRVVSYPIHLKRNRRTGRNRRCLRVVSYPIHLKLTASVLERLTRLRVVSYPIHLKPLSSQLKHFQWLESSVISNPSQTTMTTPDRLTKKKSLMRTGAAVFVQIFIC